MSPRPCCNSPWRWLVWVTLWWLPNLAVAQTNETPASDTLQVADTLAQQPTPMQEAWLPDPRKTLRWSLLPAGGQIYNRRWWKAPLVYGGFVGMIAAADFNTTNYNRLQRAYQLSLREEPHEFSNTSLDSPASLQRLRDSYDRRRQLSYVGLFLVYALQSIESFVDAHLMTFDMDEDLSIGFRPVLTPTPALPTPVAGLGLTLNF